MNNCMSHAMGLNDDERIQVIIDIGQLRRELRFKLGVCDCLRAMNEVFPFPIKPLKAVIEDVQLGH